jgi:heptosyltransferase-2
MEPKRILIIQTAFIGDVILSTPLIRALRESFPQSFISFLLIPKTYNLLENNPYLDERLVYEKRKGFISFLKIISQIKERSFDLAVIPHRSLRSALLAYWGGIPERIGFNKSAGSALLTQRVIYRTDVHEVDRNLSLLSGISDNSSDASPELFPSSSDFAYVRKLLLDSSVSDKDKIVGIAPGSVWATKRWLPERFAEVAQFLTERANVKVILLGSEDDRNLCGRIADLMRDKPLILAGRTTLLQSAAVISLCKVILSNDSAPVHMASAMKRPVVAIFGSTIPKFGFAPYRVDHVILQKQMDCRPCGIHGKRKCPQKHFGCMKEISTEEVFEAVLSLL